jgi:hypothetical protein
MIKLNNELLAEIGLGALSADLRKLMLDHIYASLELRVGNSLAGQMTEAQLDDFEALGKDGDESARLRWLEVNFPDYKETVQEQFKSMKEEIRAAVPAILRDEGIMSGEPAAEEPAAGGI